MKKVLVTGAGGLIGSASVEFFAAEGFSVFGIENNLRKYFFGEGGSVEWNVARLKEKFDCDTIDLDIRIEKDVNAFFEKHLFDLIIHTAAQPSHDWAAKEPLTDFDVNARATLILLEAARKYSPEAVFVFMSTNKVYGDLPNKLPFIEKDLRFELPDGHQYFNGIDESMSIDASTHSLFGVSKTAADLAVQEYGRYFGMKTVCFRGGCLSGPAHSGVALHGFLSHLVKSIVNEKIYTVFGHNGKQVRDNLHSYDVASAIYEFYKNPKSAAVYNLGGTRESNISMKEAIKKIEALCGKKAKIEYNDMARVGDHIWYITDMSRFKKDYPDWKITKPVDVLLDEMVKGSL